MAQINPTNVGMRATPGETEMIEYIKKHSDAKTNSQVLRRGLYELYDNTRRRSRQSERKQG